VRVLLSTWGSRGDVEPLLGFAVALKELGAEVRLCAPPDFADLAARVGVEMLPAGTSVRELVHGAHDKKPLTPADAPRVAAELVAAPPVYVSFGSVRAPENAAVVAIEAVRAQSRLAVISRGWANLTAIDDRDDCFVAGEVNHQALFSRVAAVVHHGGAGTTTTATRAGAPQVVLPQIADQPYWAGRVDDLGIGVAHDGSTPTFESFSAALESARSPETRARASDVTATIRTDGAATAATLLLDAVGQGA
jgi:vancomycin aglycone glucosyltransferase